MRPLELIGKLLIYGCYAEMQRTSSGTLLVVKPQEMLSRVLAQIICKEGFCFKYCYSQENAVVLVFLKNDLRQ
jgi:hypothetical protein